jgi:hypothetical protein
MLQKCIKKLREREAHSPVPKDPCALSAGRNQNESIPRCETSGDFAQQLLRFLPTNLSVSRKRSGLKMIAVVHGGVKETPSPTRSSFVATSDHASVDSESLRDLVMFLQSDIVEVDFCDDASASDRTGSD